MWGKAIVVVLLAVLANFYLGGRTERPSDAANTETTESVCPASVTTSPENGRNFLASFAASQSTWHVGATAAMSWASGSW